MHAACTGTRRGERGPRHRSSVPSAAALSWPHTSILDAATDCIHNDGDWLPCDTMHLPLRWPSGSWPCRTSGSGSSQVCSSRSRQACHNAADQRVLKRAGALWDHLRQRSAHTSPRSPACLQCLAGLAEQNTQPAHLPLLYQPPPPPACTGM
jgi:hypothetical protein